jgi:hypothetical protein
MIACFRISWRGAGSAQSIAWLLVCVTAMQLDATSMESHPVSPHPDQLRTSTGGLFHPASMIQKSNIYQIEANACFKNNKYKEAIDLFAQAIESNPV